jgi:CheY-like chemotaxis protein
MAVPGKLVVLVIDDDPDHADLLGEFVQACDQAVRVVRTAREALALLAVEQVQLILVDLVLPDLHGTELITRIRALGITCRIVATTGFPGKAVHAAAVTAGVDSLLMKPFALSKIRDEIDRVLTDRDATTRRA